MPRMPMFIQIQPLPSPQHQLPVCHGNGEAVRGEDRQRMRRRVVRAFGVVDVGRIAVGRRAR